MEITTTQELTNVINNKINDAIKSLTLIIMEQLKNFIEIDFYEKYEPRIYQRTFQFLNSVTSKVVNNESMVYLDMSASYFEISAEEQANLAAQGFHGNENIFRDGYFWEDFIDWCESNIIQLLKIELRKQGLNIS